MSKQTQDTSIGKVTDFVAEKESAASKNITVVGSTSSSSAPV
jgi:hypothetical protein